MTFAYFHYLSTAGLISHLRVAGRIHRLGQFTPDAAGHTAFAAFLASCETLHHHLVVDSADEIYRSEKLPHVRGRDRRVLTQRKLDQITQADMPRAAFHLGRQAQGRRDDEFLFAALSRHDIVSPWMQMLRTAEALFAGLHLAASACEALFQATQRNDAPTVLMIATPGGLRQCYFDRSRLRFSRCTPMPNLPPSGHVGHCLTEAKRLQQYLIAQQLMPGAHTLTICLLAEHTSDIADDTRQGLIEATLELHQIDLRSCAHRLGLKEAESALTPEMVLLHALARRLPPTQLAPRHEFHALYAQRLHRILTGVGCTSLLIASLSSTWMLHQARHYAGIENALQTQRDAALLSHHKLIASLGPLPADLDTIRLIGALGRALERERSWPAPLLRVLSGTLDRFPQVSLTQLLWTHALQANPSDAASTASPILTVSARLPDTPLGSERRIRQLIGAFTSDLESQGMHVEWIGRPADFAPTHTLHETADDAGASAPALTLRISARQAENGS